MQNMSKMLILGSVVMILWGCAGESLAPPPGQEAPLSRHDRRWNT